MNKQVLMFSYKKTSLEPRFSFSFSLLAVRKAEFRTASDKKLDEREPGFEATRKLHRSIHVHVHVCPPVFLHSVQLQVLAPLLYHNE